MLDFVSIFTKGGLLLWCYQGTGLLEDEVKAFRAKVNAFVSDVLLQEMTTKKSVYESGSLALKYRLDNEFELVFIAAYQKVLPLLYLDKLLDEIQLRFRDKYQQDLKENNFFRSFASFGGEFSRTLAAVQDESKNEEMKKRSEMRTYEDSAKSKKTIASMMENNNQASSKPADKDKVAAAKKAEPSESQELTEEERMANLSAMTRRKQVMMGGPGKKAGKVKSPKPDKKAGKKPQSWDPFMFGGRGATGEEAANLERGPKSPKAGKGGGADGKDDEEEEDRQLSQFVPDMSVVGASASESLLNLFDKKCCFV